MFLSPFQPCFRSGLDIELHDLAFKLRFVVGGLAGQFMQPERMVAGLEPLKDVTDWQGPCQ